MFSNWKVQFGQSSKQFVLTGDFPNIGSWDLEVMLLLEHVILDLKYLPDSEVTVLWTVVMDVDMNLHWKLIPFLNTCIIIRELTFYLSVFLLF